MKVVKPTVFPKPGTYSTNKIHLNLMSFTKDAKVHYTLDGSEPSKSSNVFKIEDGLLTLVLDNPDENGQIQTKRKEFTIKAKAVKDGYEDSDVATFHFALESLPIGEFFYTVLQEKEGTSPAVIRIEDQYQVKMYFVVGSERAILIDAGADKISNLQQLTDELAQGLPYDVVITHAHPDHDAQAQNFIDKGFTVYLNEDDLATYEQFGGGLTGFTDYKDGHVFDLGDCQFKSYFIPGHTKGHMVLFDEENGLLFGSDAFGNNRNTLIDTAFLHLGGGEESTMDQFLSVLQNFRYETKGKVKKIYFGHNDNVLGESYLDNLEKALQQAVDHGEDILVPTLRSAAECMGSSKISLVGNYISDLDWVGINIINLYSKGYTAENISSLSAVFVKNGTLDQKFHPNVKEYVLNVETGVQELELAAVSSSSRVKHLRINDVEVKSKEFNRINISDLKEIDIQVVAPDGESTSNYKIIVK